METTKQPGKMKILAGIFCDRESAEKAYKELIRHGYTLREINVVMSNDTKDQLFSEPHFTEALSEHENSLILDSIETGSATGGVLVGIATLIGALGSNLLIPGLGLVAMGPLAATLAGAGAGIIGGGLIGALLSADVPEGKASIFAEDIKQGKIMLSVFPRDKAEAINLSASWKALGVGSICN